MEEFKNCLEKSSFGFRLLLAAMEHDVDYCDVMKAIKKVYRLSDTDMQAVAEYYNDACALDRIQQTILDNDPSEAGDSVYTLDYMAKMKGLANKRDSLIKRLNHIFYRGTRYGHHFQ